MEKSKLATATANVRSAVAQYSAECLTANPPVATTVDAAETYVNAHVTGDLLQDCTIDTTTGGITVTNTAGTNVVPVGL